MTDDPRESMLHSVTLDRKLLSSVTPEKLDQLCENANGMMHHFKRCCLGILGAHKGKTTTENLAGDYPHFDVSLLRRGGELVLRLEDAPTTHCEGQTLVASKVRQLSAAMRDVVLFSGQIQDSTHNGKRSELVHSMLREADMLEPTRIAGNESVIELPRVLSWGGHTVGSAEYDYCLEVGAKFGRNRVEGISGGGPGTMKAFLKGNAKGFASQDIYDARQYGITALEIVEEEPLNGYGRSTVIMPTIEARLEAFLRLANAIVIFPGGAGTAEELFMALALKMHEKNAGQMLPIIITAPKESKDWVEAIDECLVSIFGEEVRQYYTIVIDSPDQVFNEVFEQAFSVNKMKESRARANDNMQYNSRLHLPAEVQDVFKPDHEKMSQLSLTRDQDQYRLAAHLRMLYKGIVYGTIVGDGIQSIQEGGKYQIQGERQVIDAVERMLDKFVAQNRMKERGFTEPCWELASS